MTKNVHKLRPFLPSDIHALRDLFAQSIEELTQDAYDDAQRTAWIETAEDVEQFAVRLSAGVTLIVGADGQYQGFATLRDNTVVDLLYVHPFAAGQGVGSTLVDALERIAAARGAASISADVSDTALPFFEHRGYAATQRTAQSLGDIWLSKTTMKKPLAPLAPVAPKAVS